jgi:hypothetical protein
MRTGTRRSPQRGVKDHRNSYVCSNRGLDPEMTGYP